MFVITVVQLIKQIEYTSSFNPFFPSLHLLNHNADYFKIGIEMISSQLKSTELHPDLEKVAKRGANLALYSLAFIQYC